jgi:aminoglycoside phosphotransferase (APT) family kinase protein
MSNTSLNRPSCWDRDDLEPRIAYVLERKMRHREQRGPYSARTLEQVTQQLQCLFAAEGFGGVRISNLGRMTGGASKEQFVFTLMHEGIGTPERLVLRMDPTMSAVETCRGREAQVLAAMAGVVPAPPVRYVDADGLHLGQPGLITEFVPGVTRPSDMSGQAVSGIGIHFGRWTSIIAPQFVGNLAKIHLFDWRTADLPYFDAPAPGTQAALRQVNWWARVWEQDLVEPMPLMTLAERWLRENAPTCPDPVLTHGDYRVGNFMFEEPSGQISAILDWELAHIGDFHDDLAWSMQKLFGRRENGEVLVSGLLPKRAYLEQYSALTGKKIDPEVLHYYQVLNAWKCAALELSTSCYGARAGQSHQDLVLAWIAATGSVFMFQLAELLKEAR